MDGWVLKKGRMKSGCAGIHRQGAADTFWPRRQRPAGATASTEEITVPANLSSSSLARAETVNRFKFIGAHSGDVYSELERLGIASLAIISLKGDQLDKNIPVLAACQ